MKRFVASLAVLAMLFNLVPLNAVKAAGASVTFEAFNMDSNVSAAFNGVQQVGSGHFANGNVGEYAEGMCVPFMLQVENSDRTGVLALTSVVVEFDYFNQAVGYEGFEFVDYDETVDPNNLEDIVLTGANLSGSLVGFPTDAPGSVNVDITAPSVANPTDARRSYTFDIHDLPAGDTVSIAFCGRLSRTAGEYGGGASLHTNLGSGSGNQDIAINPNNLLELPRLTVIKNVVGGAAAASTFTMQVTDTLTAALAESFPGSATGTTLSMQPGTYTVGEVANPDYAMSTSGSCTDVVLALADVAQEVTCTVTNTYSVVPTASLTITKVIDGLPSDATPDDFSYILSLGGAGQPAAAFEADGTVVVPNVVVGTDVNVSELSPGGEWSVAYGDECGITTDVAMDADGLNCVITNTYLGPETGSITINKVFTDGAEGIETVENFDFFVDASIVTEGTPVTGLFPDSYSINEAWNANHAADFPDASATNVTDWYDVTVECVATNVNTGIVTTLAVDALNESFSLNRGDDIVCTITNDEKAASLTVVKLVGGIADVDSSEFIMTVTNDAGQLAAEFNGNASGEQRNYVPDTYIVSEEVNPDYIAYFSGDCAVDGSVTLEPGDLATCTVSNEYSPLPPETGRVLVTKIVEGGDALPSSFQFTMTEDDVTGEPVNFLDDGAVEFVFEVGTTFAVTEVAAEGYDSVLDEHCSGFIESADMVFECVVTNTQQTADLTVTKVVVGSDAAFTDFTYFLTLDDADPAHQAFDEDGVTVFADLPVGTVFSIVEQDHGTAWAATYEGCEGVMTVEGAHCILTNTFTEPVDPGPEGPIRLYAPCIEAGAEGRLIAHFGYQSENSDPEFIPVGFSNRFDGDASMIFVNPDSQITTFMPGEHPDAVTIDFDSELQVNWILDWTQNNVDAAGPITADASSPSCFPAEPATLTVYKVVVNNDNTQVASDFTLEVTGSNVSLDGGVTPAASVQFAGSTDPGIVVTLDAGAFAVTELGASGYNVSYSEGCSGVADAGDQLTCTVTNTEIVETSGGGGGGGGGSRPREEVLGDTDEEEVPEEVDEPVVVTPPTPIVEGATDELPRTGLPIAGLLALGSVLTFMARREKQM